MAAVTLVRLAEVFAEVSDILVVEFDLVKFLHKVTIRTSELVEVPAARLLDNDRGRPAAAQPPRAELVALVDARHGYLDESERCHSGGSAGRCPRRCLRRPQLRTRGEPRTKLVQRARRGTTPARLGAPSICGLARPRPSLLRMTTNRWCRPGPSDAAQPLRTGRRDVRAEQHSLPGPTSFRGARALPLEIPA